MSNIQDPGHLRWSGGAGGHRHLHQARGGGVSAGEALQAAGATSCVGFGYTLNTQALCSEYRLTSIIDTSTQPRYLNWWVDLST